MLDNRKLSPILSLPRFRFLEKVLKIDFEIKVSASLLEKMISGVLTKGTRGETFVDSQ